MNEYKDKTNCNNYSSTEKEKSNISDYITKENIALYCEAKQIPIEWLVYNLINNCFNELK